VTLRSGSVEREIGVELMPGPYTHLRHAERCDIGKLRDFVTLELKNWLSIGGAGRWDRTREPRRVVGSNLLNL
jgi:hypothetical protein